MPSRAWLSKPGNGITIPQGANVDLEGRVELDPDFQGPPLVKVDPATFMPGYTSPYSVLSNGNLTVAHNGGGSVYAKAIAQEVAGRVTGKWYVEWVIDIALPSGGAGVGIGSRLNNYNNQLGQGPDELGFHTNGGFYNVTGSWFASFTSTWGALGQVVGLAIDLDGLTVGLYLDGVLDKSTGISAFAGGAGAVTPKCDPYNDGAQMTIRMDAASQQYRPDGYNAWDDYFVPEDVAVPDAPATFDPARTSANATLSNGNKTITNNGGGIRGQAVVTTPKRAIGGSNPWTGIAYFEVEFSRAVSVNTTCFGMCAIDTAGGFYLNNAAATESLGAEENEFRVSPNGNYYREGNSFSNFIADWAAGDRMGLSYNFANGAIEWWKDGVSQIAAYGSGTDPLKAYVAAVVCYDDGGDAAQIFTSADEIDHLPAGQTAWDDIPTVLQAQAPPESMEFFKDGVSIGSDNSATLEADGTYSFSLQDAAPGNGNYRYSAAASVPGEGTVPTQQSSGSAVVVNVEDDANGTIDTAQGTPGTPACITLNDLPSGRRWGISVDVHTDINPAPVTYTVFVERHETAAAGAFRLAEAIHGRADVLAGSNNGTDGVQNNQVCAEPNDKTTIPGAAAATVDFANLNIAAA